MLPATEIAIAIHPKEPKNHDHMATAGPPRTIGVLSVDAIVAEMLYDALVTSHLEHNGEEQCQHTPLFR